MKRVILWLLFVGLACALLALRQPAGPGASGEAYRASEPSTAAPAVPPPTVDRHSSTVSEPGGRGGLSDLTDRPDRSDRSDQTDPPPPSPNGRLSPETLATVLPAWMLDTNVLAEFQSETLQVAGTAVTRARGRYQWDGGPFMEVEISDLGPQPSEALLRSLGFNTTLEVTNTAAGFQLTLDTTWALINHEYDREASEGAMMLFLSERFLIEIQLEGLPQASFHQVLETQLALDTLVEMAGVAER